jgi:hypothetical protein
MLGIWTEAKALAIDISFGTQYLGTHLTQNDWHLD